LPLDAAYYALGNSTALTFIKVFGATFDLRYTAEELDIWDYNIAAGGEGDNLLLLKLTELPAHGFECETEIVCHLGAREGQFEVHNVFGLLRRAFPGSAPRHHEKKARNTLIRTLPAEEKRPIAAKVQLTDRHMENLPLKFSV